MSKQQKIRKKYQLTHIQKKVFQEKIEHGLDLMTDESVNLNERRNKVDAIFHTIEVGFDQFSFISLYLETRIFMCKYVYVATFNIICTDFK